MSAALALALVLLAGVAHAQSPPPPAYAKLTWTDSGIGEVRFKVERRNLAAGSPWESGKVDTAADVATTLDVGLFQGRGYCWRVQRIGATGVATWTTGEACASTPGPVTTEGLTLQFIHGTWGPGAGPAPPPDADATSELED